jgi:predicted ArsR family transcriptional regulator
MTEQRAAPDAITSIALLDDPTRRRLYAYVAGERDAVGRDDASAAIGISRELAAFHLDRLAAGGLLVTEYRRRSGRSGPGAGRPAKLYRRHPAAVAVSLPPRDYARAADLLATGLERLAGPTPDAAVMDVARQAGARRGSEARDQVGHPTSIAERVASLVELLRRAGYEPTIDPADGSIRLGNCPYEALVASHRPLICQMNLAWAEGVAAAAEAGLRPVLSPTPGSCCVVLERDVSGASTAG